MTWKPDMTQDERDRLNKSRRKQYAKRRLRQGKIYKGRTGQLESVEYFLNLEGVRSGRLCSVHQGEGESHTLSNVPRSHQSGGEAQPAGEDTGATQRPIDDSCFELG